MLQFIAGKKIIILISLLSIFGGGAYTGWKLTRPDTPPPAATKTDAMDSASTAKTQTVKKTTRNISRPDGTKEVVTEEMVENTEKKQDVKGRTTTVAPEEKPQWRVGVNTHISLDDLRLNWRETEVKAGRRVLGPVWGELGYRHSQDPTKRSVTVGVAIEF